MGRVQHLHGYKWACSFVDLWSLNNVRTVSDLLPHAGRREAGPLLAHKFDEFTEQGKLVKPVQRLLCIPVWEVCIVYPGKEP